jgi:hypothetical protein
MLIRQLQLEWRLAHDRRPEEGIDTKTNQRKPDYEKDRFDYDIKTAFGVRACCSRLIIA